ncbi:MAG: Uncharacterised protein [Polaribacter sp. SA4-10]|nr:MAG: Uncharacterised protein [Polaribacter sp. SA4-10]
MKTNKIDNYIKNTLKSRTITPVASAWERLSAQLDAQPEKKKRGLFFYMGIAASLLALVSVGVQLFSNDIKMIPLNNEIVIQQTNPDVLNDEIEKNKNEVPDKNAIATLVLKDEPQGFKRSIENKKRISVLKEEPIRQELFLINKSKENALANSTEKETKIISINEKNLSEQELKHPPKSSIKVNPQDLLYAVAHSQEEVVKYYEKHNLSKTTILKIIKNEVEKSNLKVNPYTILAEVEKTIYDTEFENNFLKTIQKRVSTLASVIANRND